MSDVTKKYLPLLFLLIIGLLGCSMSPKYRLGDRIVEIAEKRHILAVAIIGRDGEVEYVNTRTGRLVPNCNGVNCKTDIVFSADGKATLVDNKTKEPLDANRIIAGPITVTKFEFKNGHCERYHPPAETCY